MHRYPLALPVVVTISTTWLFSMLEPSWWSGTLSGAVLLTSCLLALRSNLCSLSIVLASASIGACGGDVLRQQLGPLAGAHQNTCQRVAVVDARCDGYVEQILSRSARMQRYVLRGEVDTRHAPCMMVRVMVSEVTPTRPVAEGQRRIVTGRLRRPLWPTLDGEFAEGAFMRSMGCAFIIERGRGMDVGPAPMHVSWILHLRELARQRIIEGLPADVAPVVIALVIGDRSMIDAESRQAYRLSGTAHIFSVSGSHVAIITWIVLLVIGRGRGVMALTFAVMIIALYTMLAGAEPPAVRSAIMGIGTLIGMSREQDVQPVNMLLLSIFVIVILDPLACLSGGFALSVSATLSLIVLLPMCRLALQRMIIRRRRPMHAVTDAVAVSWAAALGVTAPGAMAFGALSIAAPVANLIVVPLLSTALLLGLAHVLLPLPVISEAVSWWLIVTVRTADSVARWMAVDVTRNLALWNVTMLGIAMTMVLAWPLFARSWKGLGVRMTLSACLFGIMLHSMMDRPADADAVLIIERRGGLVIEAASNQGCVLLLLGAEPGPVDGSLVRWAQYRRHDVVVGLGPWGRRIKGAILHDTDTTLRR